MSVETTTEITAITRNTNLDQNPLPANSLDPVITNDNDGRGCCFWANAWRILRHGLPIMAYNSIFQRFPSDDIPYPDNLTSISGLTTDGTNLFLVGRGGTGAGGEGLRLVTIDISQTVLSSVLITKSANFPTGYQNSPSAIAYDLDNNVVWCSWGDLTAPGSSGYYTSYDLTGGDETDGFNTPESSTTRLEGLVWYEGNLVSCDRTSGKILATDLNNRTADPFVITNTLARGSGMGILGANLYVLSFLLPNSIRGFTMTAIRHHSTSITDSVVAVADTIAKLGVFTRAVSDDIAGTTDTISADKDLTIPVSDVIPALTDAIEKRLGREITDTITGVTDIVTATAVTDNISLTDTIPAVTDILSKSKGYLRTLDGVILESLGDPVSIGSISSAFVTNRGMAFWPDENVLFVSYVFASNSNIIIIRYDPSTHTFTVTVTDSYELLGKSISALAFVPSESKLLIATTSNIRQVDATPDEDNGAALAENAITLTADDPEDSIPTSFIQSMTYHPASGRLLVGVVGSTRRIFDFLYDSATAKLSDKRELEGDYTTGDNIRSITLHGDTLVISNIDEDEIQAYDYDPVAGTLNNERTLREEDNINATTFAGDQYLLIRDQTIYRHQYVSPFSGDIPVADTITSAFNRSISDVIAALTDELTTAGDNTIPLSDSITAPTDIVNANKDLTIPVSDVIPALTDAINRDIEKTIPLTDIIPAPTDAISSTGTNNIPLTDTITAPTDTIEPSRTYTRQITDAINGITDTVAKTKGFFRNLEDSGSSEETTVESISDPEDIATINADRIPIRGMAYHAATNNVYSAYKDGNEDQILSRTYTNRVLNATFVSRFVALTTFTPTSIAIAGNKLLIALNASTNPLDAIHDFSISATGALSAQRELRVEDIPRAVHGMAVHIPSGKVIFTDPPDNRVWDYDYDPDAASDEDHLSNKRGILDENVRLNPRTITFHGDIAIIGDPQSGKVHRYTYDPVAGTLTEEADLFDEANVSASTMVGNDYLYGVSGGSEIRRRVFTPAGTATLSLSFTDTITKVTSYTRAVTDGITALADEIGTIIGKRFALSDSVADATDEVTRAVEQNRDITDAIAAPTDMIDAQGADDISVSDDIIAPTDNIEKDSEIHIPISDDITAITDNITKADGAGRTLSDGITAPTDTITPSRTYTRQITDAINGITDNITRAGTTYTRNITDTIHSITDTITETRRYTRNITDTIHSITDMIGLSSSAGISLTDTITAPTDTININKSYGRTVTDTISSVTDDITKRISKTITDTIRRVTDRIRITRPLVHGTPTRTYKLGYPLHRTYHFPIMLKHTHTIPLSLSKPKRIYVNTTRC